MPTVIYIFENSKVKSGPTNGHMPGTTEESRWGFFFPRVLLAWKPANFGVRESFWAHLWCWLLLSRERERERGVPVILYAQSQWTLIIYFGFFWELCLCHIKWHNLCHNSLIYHVKIYFSHLNSLTCPCEDTLITLIHSMLGHKLCYFIWQESFLLIKIRIGITSWNILSEFDQSNVAMSLMIN